MYTAIILDEKYRNLILNGIIKRIPKEWELICHHMTICMGIAPDSLKDKLGLKYRMVIDAWGVHDKNKCIAVRISKEEYSAGTLSKNKVPHITVAVNREIGGKPVNSNEITQWNSIDKFAVWGTLKEIK